MLAGNSRIDFERAGRMDVTMDKLMQTILWFSI